MSRVLSLPQEEPGTFSMPQTDTIITAQGQSATVIRSDSAVAAKPVQRPPGFRFSDNDSLLFANEPIAVPGYVPRIFQDHLLQAKGSAPESFYRRTPDWFTLCLVIVVIAFTWIRVFYFKIFRQLFNAFFSNSITNQIVRDENILVQRASILMSFIFYMTSALFLYQVIDFFGWSPSFLSDGFLRFLIICLSIAFTYSFKMVLLKALGEIFGIDKPVATYIFNIFLINNMLGLMLIPVVVGIAYVATVSTTWVVWAGVVMVIIGFIYRLVRAFTIWLTLSGVSYFYLILYFCTLEIAPLVILIKLVQG